MERIRQAPRSDLRAKLEAQGFIYHTNQDGSPYWDETAHYLFQEREVLELESATNEIYGLCLNAAEHIIERDLFAQLGIPALAVPLIRRAWEAEPPSIYARLDLAYNGQQPPKLLEVNADTPTALLEASVIQWNWFEETALGGDQFNSIHERLIDKWRELKSYLRGSRLHLTATRGSWEDEMTCAYLADCANQAGIETRFLYVDEIGWDSARRRFVDLEINPMSDLFKLYPWEWLLAESFAPHIPEVEQSMQWIEPVWRMLWNKGILAMLWELNPGHPNLLPAYLNAPRSANYVRKPFFSREGQNITLALNGQITTTPGSANAEQAVYQEYVELPTFHGQHPVIGSWLIDGIAAGIGIRESPELITTGESHFVPHRFR